MKHLPIINKININNILEYDESDKINTIKKDSLGEVFTPLPLCLKILKLLPNHFWKNPHLKWCEPSAGKGYFMIVIYAILMKGLTEWEPNETKRRNHIIQNMLYFIEIDKDNCKHLVETFGPKANIYCGNYLDIDFDFKFDIIVGNPPFQDNYGVTAKGKRILGGKTKLYEKIFIKSYNNLKQNGFLAFITPDNIFSGLTESYNLLVSSHVKSIYFGLKEYFPTIQQDMCYFILQKESNTNANTTNIINNSCNSNITVALVPRPLNPIKCWNQHNETLIKKYIINERNSAVYNRGKNVNQYINKNKGTKFELVYTKDKMLHTNNPNLAVGFGIKKAIIFFISPTFDFKMDYTGKYGIGPNTFYIPFKTVSQGKRLEQFLKSDDYKDLANATKVSRQYIKIALIEYLNLNKIMNTTSQSQNHSYNKTNKSNKTRKNK